MKSVSLEPENIFNKVKRFGDVPWYDVDLQTNDTELLYKGRDPRLSVVNHIIDDLKFAATNMKEPSLVSKGQLHKYVAYALLARVCLYEGTWMKYQWHHWLGNATERGC